MQSLRSLLLVACLPTLACGPGKSVGIDDSTSDDTTSTEATTSDTDETTSDTTDDDSDPGDDEGGGFVPDDEPGHCGVCDTFLQDCPDGTKCVPGPEDRGSGSCGPPSCKVIVGDKQPGEPCSVDDDGNDDCEQNSWCYPAMLDIEGPAFCIEFCSGTPDNSSCTNPDEVCVFDRFTYWGDLGCRPRCNPLQPTECAPGEACTLGTSDQRDFGCVIASADLAPGEVCGGNQQCDAGLCVDAAQLPECADESCCASLCDTLAPECPDGTQCVPVELADNPESTVGVCRLAP